MSWLFPLLYLFLIGSAQAMRIPFVKRSYSGAKFLLKSGNGPVINAANDDVGIGTTKDLLYIANVTIAGIDYPVQLDTGSSDLWIGPSLQTGSGVTSTALTFNLTYGVGWASGPIARAPVSFAGYTVQDQAFVNAAQANNPVLNYGAVGVIGLGFTSLSNIEAAVIASNPGSTFGRPFLLNAFASKPSAPNFISFTFQRSTDPTPEVQGSFTIGEFDPQYTAIANTAQIPTWPVSSPSRWNVLLDSFVVNGETQAVTSVVKGVPTGKAVALLDSGTSYTYAPTAVVKSIFSKVPGAQFSDLDQRWVVPCDQEVDVTLVIGGRQFDIHPLDVVSPSVSDPSVCQGTFIPQTLSVGSSEFDWLIGDNILRSVYTVYDFGDFDSSGNMGNPYVKILSLISPRNASADFHAVRGGVANSTFSNAPDTTTNSGDGTGDGSVPGASAPSTTLSVTDALVSHVDSLVKFAPILLGVVALNSLLLIILFIMGICLCRRSGKGRKGARGSGVANGLGSGQEHSYQSVPVADSDESKSDENTVKKGYPPAVMVYQPGGGKDELDLQAAKLSPGDDLPSPTPTQVNYRIDPDMRSRKQSMPLSFVGSLADTVVENNFSEDQPRRSVRLSMHIPNYYEAPPIVEADESRPLVSNLSVIESEAHNRDARPDVSRSESQESTRSSRHSAMRSISLPGPSRETADLQAARAIGVLPPAPAQAYQPGDREMVTHSRMGSRASILPPSQTLSGDDDPRRLSRISVAAGIPIPPSPTRSQLSVPFPSRPTSSGSPSPTRTISPLAGDDGMGGGDDTGSRRSSRMPGSPPNHLPVSPSGLRPLSLVAGLNAANATATTPTDSHFAEPRMTHAHSASSLSGRYALGEDRSPRGSRTFDREDERRSSRTPSVTPQSRLPPLLSEEERRSKRIPSPLASPASNSPPRGAGSVPPSPTRGTQLLGVPSGMGSVPPSPTSAYSQSQTSLNRPSSAGRSGSQVNLPSQGSQLEQTGSQVNLARYQLSDSVQPSPAWTDTPTPTGDEWRRPTPRFAASSAPAARHSYTGPGASDSSDMLPPPGISNSQARLSYNPPSMPLGYNPPFGPGALNQWGVNPNLNGGGQVSPPGHASPTAPPIPRRSLAREASRSPLNGASSPSQSPDAADGEGGSGQRGHYAY